MKAVTPEGVETPLYKPNELFKYSHKLFNNLLLSKRCSTMYPIVSMAISNDSKFAITITKKNDKESWVKFYNLETRELSFQEKIGGEPN